MTEIKRYEVVSVDGVPGHRPSESGRWVKYEDLSALQEQVRALAAERDGSLKAIADIYMAVIGGRPGWSNWQAYLDDIVEEVGSALREIRAQAVDSFSEDCKVKSSKESHVFWMDASSAAEEYAARIRSGEQP